MARVFTKPSDAMQRSTTAAKVVACTTGAVAVVVAPNDRRIALTILPDKANPTSVWVNDPNGVGTPGVIPASGGALVLDVFTSGDQVRAGWYGKGNTATCNLTVIEVINPGDCGCETEEGY